MANWYVKELSKLTNVSVQTLHHYDKIDLLKPSVRLPNGYRLYSESDLSKLQQIIALKFFGFELVKIKELLTQSVSLRDHFAIQSRILEEQAKILLNASEAMKKIIFECGDKSIPWGKIIETIEVYRMTQEFEKTWVSKAFNQEEMKQYVSFEKHAKEHFSENELKTFEDSWDDLVQEVNANLAQDPSSTIGKDIGRRVMEWVNQVYGKEYKKLSIAMWEKAFKGGHINEEHPISSQAIQWMDKAIDSYYRDRISEILNQIGKQADAKVLKEWEALMTEIYGNEQDLKDEVRKTILKESSNQVIINWLKQHYGK